MDSKIFREDEQTAHWVQHAFDTFVLDPNQHLGYALLDEAEVSVPDPDRKFVGDWALCYSMYSMRVSRKSTLPLLPTNLCCLE